MSTRRRTLALSAYYMCARIANAHFSGAGRHARRQPYTATSCNGSIPPSYIEYDDVPTTSTSL